MLIIKVSLVGCSGWKKHYILRFQLEFHWYISFTQHESGCFSLFFVSVVDLWSIIWVLHSSGALVSALFVYFQLTLAGMRRGPYLFVIMLITEGVFMAAQGEINIAFCVFNLHFTNIFCLHSINLSAILCFFCPCGLGTLTLICEILVGVTCFCITCACTFHIYSTWTDRNEKSHFISSFYVYYQNIFTWLFRMERILHFAFSTCMSLTDFTYTAWIWLLFFVSILCGGYCLVLHVSVSLVSALSTYFSTWSDRNEKSHFHSSFYVYYQSVFIWPFQDENNIAVYAFKLDFH